MILQSWLDICVSRLDNHVSKVNDNHSKVGHTCVQGLIHEMASKMNFIEEPTKYLSMSTKYAYSTQVCIQTK